MKALAVSTRQCVPQLPDVSTVAETIPGLDDVAWNGYATAGDFSPEAVGRLVAAPQVIARDAFCDWRLRASTSWQAIARPAQLTRRENIIGRRWQRPNYNMVQRGDVVVGAEQELKR